MKRFCASDDTFTEGNIKRVSVFLFNNRQLHLNQLLRLGYCLFRDISSTAMAVYRKA